MAFYLIKERGFFFPPSILREDGVVTRPNPWRKDSATGYPVTTQMCQENLMESLISSATHHRMISPIGFVGQ
jgi:hypothetical protein